ncbi:hypothetical protein GCM10028801_46060 [Nocardioides maradonensis]
MESLAASGGPLPELRPRGRLRASLPAVPADLGSRLAAVGPLYASAGAMRQFRDISKHALADRRKSGAVLAVRAGQETFAYSLRIVRSRRALDGS